MQVFPDLRRRIRRAAQAGQIVLMHTPLDMYSGIHKLNPKFPLTLD